MVKRIYILWVAVAMFFATATHAQNVTQQELQEGEGWGIVQRVDLVNRTVTVNEQQYKIHNSTHFGQVVSWPGEVYGSDISGLQVGDQVYFGADISKPKPYQLQYIYRAMQ
jgi:hypothetical protein